MSQPRPSYRQGFARNAAEAAHPELWRGLIAAYVPSLGPTGGVLRDHGTTKSHGTLRDMDPATDWVVGANGYGLDFEGTDDCVECGAGLIDTLLAGAPAMSIAAHVYPRSVPITTGIIFGAANNGGTNSANLRIDPVDASNCKFRVGGRSESADAYQSHQTATQYAFNTNYSVVGVLDFAHDIAAVNVDGREEGRTAVAFGQPSYTSEGSNGIDQLGANNLGILVNFFFDGVIESCLIYDRVLQSREIALLDTGPAIALQARRRRVYSIPAAVAVAGGTFRRYLQGSGSL